MGDPIQQLIVLAGKMGEDLRQAFQKQTDAIHQSEKTARENKQDPLPVPLPVIAELKVPEAIETARTKRENRAHRVQVWLAGVTTLTFIAAAVYATIAGFQWADLRHQTNLIDMNARRERRDAANPLMVAQDQAHSAQEQADAARDSVTAVRQQMRQDQRPWLEAAATPIQFNLGQPIESTIKIINLARQQL